MERPMRKGSVNPSLYRARVGNCVVCGKEYRAVKDHHDRKQKYCSVDCYRHDWKMRIEKTIKRTGASGESNHSWKGDEVGYSGIHKWVERQRGNPEKCEFCGTTTASKFEWANLDHEYERDLDDYVRLCTSCHRRYDNRYLSKVS